MKRWSLIAPLLLAGFSSAALAGARQDMAAARATMVADIGRMVRAAAPGADTPDLRRALAVIAQIPRERFVPASLRKSAYRQRSLPIGFDQTISDAYIVAVMTAAARIPAHANVLDVGTGSGYQAAVLSRLADRVSSVEIVKPLAEQAGKRLARLGFSNVEVRAGDGYAGWPEHAPFDAIIVAAGAAAVPQPLVDQLKPGGHLVMPIGPTWAQEQILVLTKARDGTLSRCSLGWSMFVPLTGKGERAPDARGLLDSKIPLCYEGAVARADFEAPAK